MRPLIPFVLLAAVCFGQSYDCATMQTAVTGPISSVSSCAGFVGSYTLTWFDNVNLYNWRTGATTLVSSQTAIGTGYCLLAGSCGKYPVQAPSVSESNGTWTWIDSVTRAGLPNQYHV